MEYEGDDDFEENRMLIWVLNKKKQECEYPQNICLLVWKDMCLSGNGKHPSHETASVSECLLTLKPIVLILQKDLKK